MMRLKVHPQSYTNISGNNPIIPALRNYDALLLHESEADITLSDSQMLEWELPTLKQMLAN
jgi:hypothetical protein